MQSVLDQHDHLLGDLNTLPPRKELDALVAKLDDSAAAHERLRVIRNGQTARKAELRESLLNDHLRPIVRVKDMSRREMAPIATLEMPDAHITDGNLLTKARAISELAEPYREVFVRNGLPREFVEQLGEAERGFRNAIVERDRTHGQWISVTEVIDNDLVRAKEVATAIVALVRQRLGKKSQVLGELRRAKLHRAEPTRQPALQGGKEVPAIGAGKTPPSMALVRVEDPAPKSPLRRIAAIVRLLPFGKRAS